MCRFYQAGRHTAEKAAKCPEPLCPTRVLPPLERRGPSPGKVLSLRHRSYWLIRRSRWALSAFGFWPRLESPCRLLPAPAAHSSFPTLSLRICPWMLDPLPRRYTVCLHLFLRRRHRPSPRDVRSASRIYSANNDFSRDDFRGCRYSVMFRPPSLLAPRIVPTAANTGAGQLGLLHPGTSCFVTSARSGYANRPNTGNWRYGDLHPARLSALSAAPITPLHHYYEAVRP